MMRIEADRSLSAAPAIDILAQCQRDSPLVPAGTGAVSLNPPYDQQALRSIKTFARDRERKEENGPLKQLSVVEIDPRGKNSPTMTLAALLAAAKPDLAPDATIGLKGYRSLSETELSQQARSTRYTIVHQPDANQPGVVIYDPKGGVMKNPNGWVGDGGLGGRGCGMPAGYHPGTPRQTRA